MCFPVYQQVESLNIEVVLLFCMTVGGAPLSFPSAQTLNASALDWLLQHMSSSFSHPG
jgi:hypothetical protein